MYKLPWKTSIYEDCSEVIASDGLSHPRSHISPARRRHDA